MERWKGGDSRIWNVKCSGDAGGYVDMYDMYCTVYYLQYLPNQFNNTYTDTYTYIQYISRDRLESRIAARVYWAPLQ